jgi:hypothetical protein
MAQAAPPEEYKIPAGLTTAQLEWIKGFNETKKGNLSRQGCMTDLRTRGGITLPYRINIFRNHRERELWTWAVVLNPQKDMDQNEQDYSNLTYDDPYLAALGALEELSKHFEISDTPPVITKLRSRFRDFARNEFGIEVT